ncbi:MAG: hypothetical protein RMJ66_01260 [Bacteroidia bacterium]|nr:ACP phosphodiesterase [Bacteroidia bacterium]MDW8133672.1 hypothetical protein [Bacteroidia bacterium]
MHHLGHIFLAKSPPAFRFGAFIADGVRQKQLTELPPLIQAGIHFHRWVDWQTDRHPAFLAARRLLRDTAGRYAGLIVDMWLDATLGENWASFSPDESLTEFEDRFIQECLKTYCAWAPPHWNDFIERLSIYHLLQLFGRYEGMKNHIFQYIQRRRLPLNPSIILAGIEEKEQVLTPLLIRFWEDAQKWAHTAESFRIQS